LASLPVTALEIVTSNKSAWNGLSNGGGDDGKQDCQDDYAEQELGHYQNSRCMGKAEHALPD
jgi:hypothetical protein